MPGSLAARDISKSYAAVQVLDRVSLVVSPGDRVGIVGPNGIGKSTLLRVLAGLEEPDRGQIVRGGAVGLLPQEPEARAGETVLGYLARRTGVGAAEHEMDALAARLGDEPELAGAYGDALDRFLALGGEDFEARARAVLSDVGLGPRTERQMTSLSGGEAARAALAAILLARFDVFLLDEPTNNLDFAGLARLERFLDGLAAGVVLVSHDRAFLDRSVTRVVEIEAETRKVHEYTGTWSEYEAARERARAQHERDYADYLGERSRYTELLRVRREEAHLLGGERKLARQTGGSDRRATNALRGKVQPGEEPPRAARGGREAVDAVAAAARPADGGRAAAGSWPSCRAPSSSAASFTLGPVSLELHWGDRLAVVGANGSGKTTLIGALLGELPLAARLAAARPVGRLRRAEPGPRPVLGRPPRRLRRGLGPARGGGAHPAREVLARAGGHRPPRARASRRASGRAPGSRCSRRRGVNCLVLDEPTNHLDLEAIEELETALETYEGCLVVVTHDRRFLERLSVSRTLEL